MKPYKKLSTLINKILRSAAVVLVMTLLITPTSSAFDPVLYRQTLTPFYDALGSSSTCTTTLIGSTSAEQAWNYFKSPPRNLSDAQTAAILGNLRRESGINPRRVQNTPTPAADSDVNPLDGITGYGIAQWTNLKRQQALSQYAVETNRSVSSLDLQLDFIYKEMTQGKVWENLKSITGNDIAAITEATVYIEESYENSADKVGTPEMGERITGAIRFYNLYSGSTPVTDPTPEQPVCDGAGPGAACLTGPILGWQLSGECKMVSYDQTDTLWANHPYGSGKSPLANSGCGPTSLAMIAATLLRDSSITPVVVGDRYGDQYHIKGGSSWGLFPVFASDYNLRFTDLGTNLDGAAEIVRNGGLVVISADPGYFTNTGHLMVIRAVSQDGTEFYLTDPNGDGLKNDSETRSFTANFLRSSGAMKHLWGYSK